MRGAVLTGATSLPAISEWAAHAPPTVQDRLGARRCPLSGTRPVPHETTIRRTLAHLDADALDRAVGAWLADRRIRPGPKARRAVAVDGKSLPGAARTGGRKIHLLAALDQQVRRRWQISAHPRVNRRRALLAGGARCRRCRGTGAWCGRRTQGCASRCVCPRCQP
ncbi:transposase family protein [Streptomyces olivochromogenes]|uniref:transposase family protein n=1 Tax=Streptomyces olivochromogenes TaxID=1963 RepID=UPI0036DC8930